MINGTERDPAGREAHGIHVVAKPIGPACNLNCEYCFYLEKQALFDPGEKYRMSDEVLSAFITNYITSQPTPAVRVRLARRGADPAGHRLLQTGDGTAEALYWTKDDHQCPPDQRHAAHRRVVPVPQRT